MIASQARLFRSVAELNACESCEEEEEELFARIAATREERGHFENIIVTWDPGSGFIA